MNGKSPTLLLIGGAVLLIAVGVLVSVLSPRSSRAEYAPGSPEAAVAEYIKLRREGRNTESNRVKDPNNPEAEYLDYRLAEPGARIGLVSSQTTGSTATVVIEVSSLEDGGAFLPSESYQRIRFHLRQTDGRWIITQQEPVY